jgi:hypothetical protein
MTKDRKKCAATGDWGWKAWVIQTNPWVTDAAKQCFECHQAKKEQDYVYSI